MLRIWSVVAFELIAMPVAALASLGGMGGQVDHRPPVTAPTSAASVSGPERPVSDDPAEDGYVYGFRLWMAKQYDLAIVELRNVVQKYPTHRRASYAQNLLGRALLDQGKPALAATAFFYNYQKMPNGERAPDSLYYLAQALMAMKKPAGEVCKVYNELIVVYGDRISETMAIDVANGRAASECKGSDGRPAGLDASAKSQSLLARQAAADRVVTAGPSTRKTSAVTRFESNRLYIFVEKPPAYASDRSNYPVGNNMIAIRASSEQDARSIFFTKRRVSSENFTASVLNTENKCLKGNFVFGFNKYHLVDSKPRAGIVAYFVGCNFINEDEVIRKGVLNSGKTFFNWRYGSIQGQAGMVNLSGSCEYVLSLKRWMLNASGNEVVNGDFCERLNREVPILTDREPQEAIFIGP